MNHKTQSKKTRVAALTVILALLCAMMPFTTSPAHAAPAANLGVHLGGGSEATADVTLNQTSVYTTARELVRTWRLDAYNDTRIKFKNGSGTYRTVQQRLSELNMTREQYLEPDWDNALERIALQRAFEAQYIWDHKRTGNDASIWSATVNGAGSNGEVLAWTVGMGDFRFRFGMWMSEKADYIKLVNGQSVSGATGHYTSIIDPVTRSLAFGSIGTASAGAINGGSGNTQPLHINGQYRMSLAVHDDLLAKATVNGLPTALAVGGKASATVSIPSTAWEGRSVTHPAVSGSWITSNPNVISVSGTMLTAVGAGSATVSFRTTNGKTVPASQRTITVQRFTDVNGKTPHEADINWLADNGISTGYANANGTRRFEGMTSVYRQDMAAFLRREAKARGIADAATWTPSAADWNRFKDVDDKTPHAEDILWLAHAGISTGWKEKDGTYTFRGMSPVVRQDMAAFLKRLSDKAGKAGGVTPKTDFTDVGASTPHRAEVEWLGGSGISQGYRNPDGSWRFGGMTDVYRQDMAAFIHRLDNLLTK